MDKQCNIALFKKDFIAADEPSQAEAEVKVHAPDNEEIADAALDSDDFEMDDLENIDLDDGNEEIQKPTTTTVE